MWATWGLGPKEEPVDHLALYGACDTCGATRRVLEADGLIQVACSTDRSH